MCIIEIFSQHFVLGNELLVVLLAGLEQLLTTGIDLLAENVELVVLFFGNLHHKMMDPHLDRSLVFIQAGLTLEGG